MAENKIEAPLDPHGRMAATVFAVKEADDGIDAWNAAKTEKEKKEVEKWAEPALDKALSLIGSLDEHQFAYLAQEGKLGKYYEA